MKNTTSKSFNLRSDANLLHADSRINLLSVNNDGATELSPAPSPTLRHSKPWQPWHIHHSDLATYTFLHMPAAKEGVSQLAVECNGVVTPIGGINGKPFTPLSIDGSHVSFCTAAGRRSITLIGGSWELDDEAIIELPQLEPRSNGSVSASTGAIALKSMAPGAESLTSTHIDELTDRLTDCYRQIAASATAAGRWLQPSLMGIRITDRNGKDIASAPALIMAPNGRQATGTLEAKPTMVDTTLQIPDIRLEANTYLVDLHIPDGLSAKGDFVEVWALPQQHILDTSMKAPARLYSRSDGWHISTAVPGATLRFASRERERARELLNCSTLLFSEGSCIARFDISEHEGSTVTLNASSTDLDGWSRTLEASAKRSESANLTSAESTTLAAIAGGAEFTAATVASGGDTIVWGNISYRNSPLFSPAVFASAIDTSSGENYNWQASVEVTTGSGRRIVKHFEGTNNAPTALLPMISYPSRDAILWRLIVEIEETGERLSVTLPLSPAAEGSQWANFINESLQPIPLTSTTDAFPAETELLPTCHPSMILLSSATNPLRPVAALLCGTAPIHSIIGAIRSRSAWDAAHARFLAFTSEGVMGVSGSARQCYLRATHIDRTLAPDASAIAAGADAIYCTAGNHLLRCASNSLQLLSATLLPTQSMAWHRRLNALMLLDIAGNVTLLTFDAAGKPCHSSLLALPFQPSSIGSAADGSVWMLTDTSLYSFDMVKAQSTIIGITSTLTLNLNERPTKVMIDLCGKRIDGSIQLIADNYTATAHPLAEWRIDGSVERPLTLPFAAPARRTLQLRLQAQVSDDFRLFAASLISKKSNHNHPSHTYDRY